jgi:hypothetical protein
LETPVPAPTPITPPPFLRTFAALAATAALALAGGCSGIPHYTLAKAEALQRLAEEPLPTQPWTFGDAPGHVIRTEHFRIFTTIDDGTYQRLLARVLEATHARMTLLHPNTRESSAAPTAPHVLDCYVFNSRGQWEAYTRARAGSNAPIYLQISAGGYCQEGVFAGYDIGREQTLSVVSHEAWHQYSWFAFKDRLPSWLEEGLATQNEAVEWEAQAAPGGGGKTQLQPIFRPEMNWRRFSSLQAAVKADRLWKLSDLLSTHAGQVIKMNQQRIDAYYAQLWSLVLFLESSPTYRPRLESLLADAAAGKLTGALAGTGVTKRQIDNFTEKWNTVAGPVYTQKYFTPDLAALEKEYLAWVKEFSKSWPPGGTGR